MATVESVKAKLQELINTANSTTGGTDTNLTAAVNALIAGFAQGGDGDSGASGIYMAKVTPAENVNTIDVVHNLDTTDILLAACWAETMGDIVPAYAATMGKIWTKTDITNNRGGTGNSTVVSWNATNSYVTMGGPNTSGYWDVVTDANTFTFKRGNSGSYNQFIAGITYTVIIMAASAFSAS